MAQPIAADALLNITPCLSCATLSNEDLDKILLFVLAGGTYTLPAQFQDMLDDSIGFQILSEHQFKIALIQIWASVLQTTNIQDAIPCFECLTPAQVRAGIISTLYQYLNRV